MDICNAEARMIWTMLPADNRSIRITREQVTIRCKLGTCHNLWLLNWSKYSTFLCHAFLLVQCQKNNVTLAINDDFTRSDRVGQHTQNSFFGSLCFANFFRLIVAPLLPIPHAQYVVSMIVNRVQHFASIDPGECKWNDLPLKAMINNCHCLKRVMIPKSNMRWLTPAAFSSSDLARCDQKLVWVRVHCQTE